MNKRHEKAARRKFIKKYGCDPLEVWNIDTWLAKALSHRLYVWLETGVSGHPVNVEYEIYLQELKTVADVLAKYADYDLDEGGMKAAQNALHWVAENLPNLWD